MYRRELLKAIGSLAIFPVNGMFDTSNQEVKGTENGTSTIAGHKLIIYGATPGGVALAIRAAREGLSILLVNHTQHIGGMFINGLGTMDTLYNGARSPIYDEFRNGLYSHYRSTYGKKSKPYLDALPAFPKTRYESHIAEQLIASMLQRETNITVVKGFYPHQVEKQGSRLQAVKFHAMEGEKIITVEGDTFADCSYEGDLAYITGIPMRLGRESSSEYREEHAGVMYMQKDAWPPPKHVFDEETFKLEGRMNLFLYDSWSDIIHTDDNGKADKSIQAFNFRTTLTTNPNNRIIPKAPENYNPADFKEYIEEDGGPGLGVPNDKTSCNFPELVGEQDVYINGDWAIRKQVTQRFKEKTLGLIYFLQNDPSVPEKQQLKWKEYGLAKDEYSDNDYMPYEIYVREGRRLIGKKVFTENDALLHDVLKRAPIHADSISVTEWFMDSHACTTNRISGSKLEGEVMLKNKTFPGQVPLDTLFTHELENFMVPVCLSASHIGWGAIRLEPTWMSIGEAAGYIVALAQVQQISVSKVKADDLLVTLAENKIMISFFNDVEGREYSDWYPAIQYLGTKGFFGTYEARPDETLSLSLANAWVQHLKQWLAYKKVEVASVKKVLAADDENRGNIAALEFGKLLGNELSESSFGTSFWFNQISELKINVNQPISRGNACRLIFEAIKTKISK